MSNKTTVTDLSIGGAVAVIFMWVLGYYQSGLMEALPTGGEAALGVVITGIFTYFKEAKE